MSALEVDGVLFEDTERTCGCYTALTCEHAAGVRLSPSMWQLDLIDGHDFAVLASSTVDVIDLDCEMSEMLGAALDRGCALAVRPVSLPLRVVQGGAA